MISLLLRKEIQKYLAIREPIISIAVKSKEDWPNLEQQLALDIFTHTLGSSLSIEHRYGVVLSTYNISCNESYFLNASIKRKYCTEYKNINTLSLTGGVRRKYLPNSALQNYTCKPKCPIGHTILFDQRFRWICQPCAGNSIKNTVGNYRCTSCPHGYEANGKENTMYWYLWYSVLSIDKFSWNFNHNCFNYHVAWYIIHHLYIYQTQENTHCEIIKFWNVNFTTFLSINYCCYVTCPSFFTSNTFDLFIIAIIRMFIW